MNLYFDTSLSAKYKSGAQKTRVLTEAWAAANMFCPRCGGRRIVRFENNRPVADFYCPDCGNEYELKSKSGRFGRKVSDGAYETMIARITGNRNPDFMFMAYSAQRSCVKDLFLVPKHFFTPEIIERRSPLPDTARRTGWVGCNILIDRIPQQGRIAIISDGAEADAESVVQRTNAAYRLQVADISARGWLFDVLNCVNAVPGAEFTLSDIYACEDALHLKHPRNNNIRPKIRQQLQFLRGRGAIEFIGGGKYIKVM